MSRRLESETFSDEYGSTEGYAALHKYKRCSAVSLSATLDTTNIINLPAIFSIYICCGARAIYYKLRTSGPVGRLNKVLQYQHGFAIVLSKDSFRNLSIKQGIKDYVVFLYCLL